MSELTIEALKKTYGSARAVDDVSFSVERGEFLTLLGPSGCGKSTTLGAIAGLDRPTAGKIRFRDHTLFDGETGRFEPPEARGFGVVFQSYALWPHLSVRKNVSMPLELRRVPSSEIKRRVGATLDRVGLGNYADRYPGELSGGQQQRVALARAIVFEPPLLLLDEPLSNLDAQLRQQARVWLKDIQRDLGLTSIYVTHDQDEALAMSDRIIVMRGGKIVQMGTPQQIYDEPTDPFAATFIGNANLLDGQVQPSGPGGSPVFILPDGQTIETRRTGQSIAAGPAQLAVRGERILVGESPSGTTLDVIFGGATYMGDHHEQLVQLCGQNVRLRADKPEPAGAGKISIRAQDAIVFAGELK